VIATLGGWLVASLAAAVAIVGWRLLSIRSEAVTRASHELRGPITAARLGLELGVRSGRLAPDRLRAIDLELDRATLALDDLGGAGLLRRAPHECGLARIGEVELRELVASSVEAWRATAEVNGVGIQLRWDGGASVVLGDRLRIAQATGNLIANAIEHGGGDVEVRGGEQRDGVWIEVIDGGPGLPAPVTELARRARRGHGHGDRRGQRQGRGRGLAIAAAVAEAHGGRLASAPCDRGARIVLKLPAGRHITSGA
jgi:signal transduction histidine kinase